MNNLYFNENEDVAPIPFDRRVIEGAAALKQAGLKWRPHVGCFVWDKNDVIAVPSPFPLDVYFILSLARFQSIFGSVESIRNQLVWIPTWHQTMLICRELDVKMPPGSEAVVPGMDEASTQGLLLRYESIADRLTSGAVA